MADRLLEQYCSNLNLPPVLTAFAECPNPACNEQALTCTYQLEDCPILSTHWWRGDDADWQLLLT
jgi:hypothetical protein